MKRLVLLAPAMVLLAASLASANTRSANAGGVAAAVRCTQVVAQQSGATAQSITLSVSARCSVLQNGKKRQFVAFKPHVQMQLFDSSGYQCGATQKSTGSTVKLVNPGAAKAQLSVKLSPSQPGLYRITGSAAKLAVSLKPLPGYQAVCATSGDVSIQPGLCSQTPSAQLSLCGTPVLPDQNGTFDVPAKPNACFWASKPSMQGNIVHAGQWACDNTGGCWTVPLRLAPTSTWLGYTMTAQNMMCANGSRQEILAESVYLLSPQGQVACGGYAVNHNLLQFSIPPSWGNTQLQVTWELQSFGPNTELGFESVGAIFPLSGNQDGCPQLESDPNTVKL